MSGKAKSHFPPEDFSGITPGHGDPVVRPPDPHTDANRVSKEGVPEASEPGSADTQKKGVPATDLVSVGTSPSNQPANQ